MFFLCFSLGAKPGEMVMSCLVAAEREWEINREGQRLELRFSFLITVPTQLHRFKRN